MCKFTHLHTHTDTSPDGLGPTDKMVKRAAEIGFDHLAVTDHGSMANTVTFWAACKEYNIKPIFGLEGYLLWEGSRYHLTLNALNKKGFENLVRLNNASHVNYQNARPLMTIDMLNEYNAGIAAFTGCPASAIHAGSETDAMIWAGTMKDIFKTRFFAEIMFVMDQDVISRPLSIAKKMNLPILVTNDVHYPMENQRNAHRIMTECRKGHSYESGRLWMKDPEQMLATGRRHFSDEEMIRWMANAWELADSTETWDLANEQSLPEAVELIDQLYEHLKDGYAADVKTRSEEDSKNRLDRIKYEHKILKDAGFLDYFAILYDIVNYAKRNNILIGPGRGSAASSYILYCLGVTGIDPIEHELPFERFMNPSRKEYPDVDLDFDSYRRHEVIDYAVKRWGAYPIATYAHYNHRSLVNDLGRTLKIPQDLTKAAAEKGYESEEFEEFAAYHPDARIAYDSMLGQIRHAGKHAGGVVITDSVVPIEKIGDDLVVAWTEGYDKQLSKAKIVKFDLLAVLALTQIDWMRKATGRSEAPSIADGDNQEVYKIFQNGNVLGIFQWTGSDGIRQLTMRIGPKRFYDLTVINSLYRPGALDAGTADQYPELMKSPRLIEPRIDEILRKTHGAIVFQEQVMRIIQTVVGGTLADADVARRLIFKPRPGQTEWEAAVKKMHTDFFVLGEKNDFARPTLTLLWEEIMTHSRYSFNLAHAASYSMLAFEMAYFKYHHPAVFYAVMMSTDPANIQSYMIEARLSGIQFLLPNINEPFENFTLVGRTEIRMPLSIVKNLSSNSAKAIREEVEENGKFKSFTDFDSRISGRQCTSRSIRFLYQLGAFAGLPGELTDIKRFKELPETITDQEAQIEGLGFVIPSIKVAQLIAEANDEYTATGYVADWKDKVNRSGNQFRVFYLAPYGSFWVRDQEKIDKISKGMLLSVDKNKWGMANKITVVKGD